MTTTTHERPIPTASEAYLTAVGAALAGVPDSDRQELLDDLAEHLREVAPESDAELIERLGTPEQYAAELLASAGIEAMPRRGRQTRLLAARLRAVTNAIDAPFVREVKAFLPDLVPAWWVARAWIILGAIAARGGRLNEAVWIPNVASGSRNFTRDLGLLVAAIVLSVWIGQGAAVPRDRRRHWANWTLTGIGIIAVLSLLTADRTNYYQVDTVSQPGPYDSGQLVGPQGNTVTNVFAYDASGKSLGPVFLFDQDGAPLDVGNATALQENGVPFVSGLFPQPEFAADQNGTTRAVQPKPPVVHVPSLPQVPGSTPAAKAKTKPKAGTPTTMRPFQSGDVPVTTVAP